MKKYIKFQEKRISKKDIAIAVNNNLHKKTQLKKVIDSIYVYPYEVPENMINNYKWSTGTEFVLDTELHYLNTIPVDDFEYEVSEELDIFGYGISMLDSAIGVIYKI